MRGLYRGQGAQGVAACEKNLYGQTMGTRSAVNTVIMAMPMISKGKPARIIRGTVTYPLAKTMAFGGVPAGIMNP